MTRTRPVLVLLVSLLVAAASFLALPTRPPDAPANMPAAGVVLAPPGAGALPTAELPLATIDAAIDTWTANLSRDAGDFIAATHLADLYLARARLTGTGADYERSLQSIDRALDAEPDLLAARVVRAQALLANHDFSGAEAEATALVGEHPTLPQALATLGDARLERGDYEGAADAYARLAGLTSAPAVTARQARLAAVTGSLSLARRLADAARAAARGDPGIGDADRAWYELLVGALAFQAGDLDAAGAAYEASFDLAPGSAQALAGLARTRAAHGDTDAAIRLYSRAVEVAPQPDSLAALGDLLLLAGRTAEAETRYAQVDAIATLEQEAGLYSRPISVALANRALHPGRALAIAAAELDARRDVYGWDAYAWALLAAGRPAEADDAMRAALAHGTEDALLDYHAGMIAAALGRADEAISRLQAALARNPGFDPLGAERAKAVLADLEADR